MTGDDAENRPPVNDSQGISGPQAETDEILAWHLPLPGSHVTGSQLRRRVMTPEKIAEALEPEPPTFLQRIFGRRQR